MRKAFNFYQSHWEQIKLLNDNQKLEIFNAICSVQFLETNIDDVSFNDGISQLVWTGIKHSISTSLSGFITKQKSLNKDIATPLSKGGAVPPCQQEKEKEKEKEQYKEKKSTQSEYDLFISELKSKAKYKSKVTKTKQGKELFKQIEDKKQLAIDYLKHQEEKQNYASVITKYMEDYKTVYKQNNNSWTDGYNNTHLEWA